MLRLSPGPDNESIKKIVENTGKPEWKTWSFWLAIAGILLAFGSFVYTALSYSDASEDRKNYNRPYIDLDTKSIKEDLTRFSKMIPKSGNLYGEVPPEKNLQFSIKNYGALPAKYKVDFSEFKDFQYNIISEPTDIDYLYPEQGKDLVFTFDYDTRASLMRRSAAAESGMDFNDLSKLNDFYTIKIRYGLVHQSEEELLYETVIRKKHIRVPCEDGRDIINPNVSCWKSRWIVVRAI